jgi:Zn-dependent peptidase ImmA (M78 family)
MQALINKETLQSICRIKEVTAAYISSKCNLPMKSIVHWINPQDNLLPTFNQAKAVSKCLHVPFAGLYMSSSDLPLEQIRRYKIKNFRTFQDSKEIDDSAINIAIGDLLQARTFLLESKAIIGEEISNFSIDFSPTYNNPVGWASEIRKIFKIELQVQFATTSSRKFYLYVRSTLESFGIFVHCFTDVDIKIARGISIYDESVPVIGINNNDRYPAKTFSMIHELVHILKRESTMCNEMLTESSHNEEEIFCNAVAGEFLVPEEALDIVLRNRNLLNEYTLDNISEIAIVFSVSKEVITRRLFDCGKIGKYAYDTYTNELNRLFRLEQEMQREASRVAREEGRQAGFSRPQVQIAIDKTSSALCRTLYNGYSEEYFSKQDIARFLGMNQKHVDKFLKEVSSWR